MFIVGMVPPPEFTSSKGLLCSCDYFFNGDTRQFHLMINGWRPGCTMHPGRTAAQDEVRRKQAQKPDDPA